MEDDGGFKFFESHEETWKTFLWNSDTKEFLGRSGKSWTKIGVFYLIYYTFLAGFFSVMMAVLYQTIDVQYKPTYIPGDGGSILRNPALGFRPLPRAENIESTLIWYKSSESGDIDHWVNELDEFIKPYEGTTDTSGQHTTECSEQDPPQVDEVCAFEDEWLGEACQKKEKWGYNRDSPCIILKLNKMFGWVPDVYQDISELPENMPEDLKDVIANETKANGNKMPKRIWVSCEGENPADMEYIRDIRYTPWRGFPAYYFPYLNTPGYRSPIVAVELIKPELHVLINIECRVWAKNILHDRSRRLGLVHFELLRD